MSIMQTLVLLAVETGSLLAAETCHREGTQAKKTLGVRAQRHAAATPVGLVSLEDVCTVQEGGQAGSG